VGGVRQENIETEIHVVNPMFGGGFDACEPNTKNPVRATVGRGHLQFWAQRW
jgi:CRISPR/Cas system CMR-associated protein Cmr1 (group 7 of RAMP superfamily)